MKELLEKILNYLPQYLAVFGAVLAGPKDFVSRKNTNAEDAFTQSLLFLGISVSVAVIMLAPLLPPNKDLWTFLGAQAVSTLLAVSLMAGALRLSWRAVGGKAPFRSFFVTYAHYFGVLFVLFIFVLLLSEGVFKVFEPDLYTQIREAKMNNKPLPDLSGSRMPFVSFIILVVGYVIAGIWGFIGWGAYRQLNNLSKARSFCAFLITAIFGWLIAAVVFFVQSAMSR